MKISSPSDGANVSASSVTVAWSGSDGTSGIKTYRYQVDEEAWNDTSSTSHTFTGLLEGSHIVWVRVYDQAWNMGNDSVSFVIDTTPPSLSISSPENGDCISSSSVTVEWSGSDGTNGIKTYRYKVETSDWTNTSDTSHPFTGLSEGSHTVQVKAYDWAGNSNKASVSFTVDTTDPVVTIHYPDNGMFFNSKGVKVNWTVSDTGTNVEYRYKLDNDDYPPSWNATGKKYDLVEHTFFPLGNGPHTVYVQARDQALNTANDSVEFTVDTVPPTIDYLTCNGTKKNGTWYINTRNVNLSWDGGDRYFSKWVIETPFGNITIDRESVKSKVISLSNGKQTVTLYAFDLAGNYNEKSIDIVVDTNPPEFYFAYLYTESHKDNDTYWSVPAGNVPFSFTFYDNYDYSLDYYVTVSLDSTIVYSSSTLLSNGSENSINLDVAGISQGVYDLTMRIKDAAENVGEKTFKEKVIVDKKAPNISFITDNETVFGSKNISVTVEVKDISHFNFTQYSLSYYGNAISPTGFDPKNRSSGTFTLNYEVSSNGTYFLSLQIVDLVGNSTTTKQLYLYVDLDPPKIESISIENWTIYGTGIIPAYAEVSDDIGLKNVSLILDGELVKVEEPEKKYASVSKNLTKLSSSRHKLTVVAFDVLDRTSSDYVIFFVDKEKPSIEDYTEGIFSSDPLINFNVSDDLAIKNLSLTISNDTYRFEDNKTFGFREEKRYEYNKTVELGSGHYLVKIRAYDFSNKTKYLHFQVIVDKNSPSVDIQSIRPSWNDSGLLTNAKEVNVSWIASDNTTSLSFKVYLNGELINETGEYVYELSLTEGTHTIGILAVDGAGNSKLDTIDLRVVYDHKPPALNFWTANGTVFSDDDINIRLEVRENTSFSVKSYLSGEGVLNETYEPGNISLPLFDLTSGDYRLTLLFKDVFDHLTEETFLFSIDLSVPEVKIYMENGTWFNVENVSVKAFLNDDVGLSAVDFVLNSSLVGEWEIGGRSSCETINLAKLSSSKYRLEVKAFDSLNRTSSDYVDFNVDTVKPKPTILKPANGARLNNSSVLVKYTIEEENLKDANLYMDGHEYKLNRTSGNMTFKLGDGGHSLLLLATDEAGNIGRDEVTFTVNTEEEVVDISYEDTLIDSTLLLNTSNAELTFNVSCSNYTVNAYLDNESIPIENDTISLEGIEDGFHTLRIVVSVNGEIISETKRTIVIDTHAPQFEKVEALSDEVFVGDNLSIVWKTKDLSGVAQYRVYVNGELYSVTQEPCASLVITEEENEILIEATDFNSFSSSKTIFIKAREDRKKTNPPEKPDTESPYKDGKREEPPYMQEKEETYEIPFFNLTFSTLSLTLIAAAIVCYFLRKKKYMALFLGVFFAFSFTVPNIDVGRRVGEGNGNGKQGKLANELKRKGYIQLYKSDDSFRIYPRSRSKCCFNLYNSGHFPGKRLTLLSALLLQLHHLLPPSRAP